MDLVKMQCGGRVKEETRHITGFLLKYNNGTDHCVGVTEFYCETAREETQEKNRKNCTSVFFVLV